MENRINRLIWEAKKSGKPVNPWAICTASIGGKIGDTKRTDWTKDQKERYEKCVKDVKKKSPIKEHKSKIVKEGRINEYGGYDDPSMYARHAGSYMGNVKDGYNAIATVLNHFDKLSAEILDDKLRKEVEKFLLQVQNPLTSLGKTIIDTEKRHIGNLRGGRPTPRSEEGE